MRVLILGAGGFVGRQLVDSLAASGWGTPIAAVRRDRSGAPGVERHVLDACDPIALAAAMRGVDAVVNAVAGSADVIARGAATLAETARGTGVRVVHLSSMAVYGAATGLVGEDTPFASDLAGYGGAKATAERLLGVLDDAVMLRPGCIYGSDSPQWSRRIARLLVQRRIGDLGAGGDGCSNIVHVRDVVAAILAALRRSGGGVRTFNLAQADAPDWNDYFLGLARAIGAVPIRRIPGWELAIETKLAAAPLTVARRLPGGRTLPDPIPPSLARLWRQDIRLDVALAERDLGLRWTSLADGLAAR